MTKESMRLISFMLKELSQLKYGYRCVVEGCYDMAINNYHLEEPTELSKDQIIDKVLEILNRRII